MQDQNNIIDCYDRTAKAYAEKFMDELRHKHFDRIILKAFAIENFNNGRLIDLGCGPGQTAKFLFQCGLTNVIGVDISPGMVEIAQKLNPKIHFEIADILHLQYADKTFDAAIAFYAIVHFDYAQLQIAFKEINRVLTHHGNFLLSFHIGDQVVHHDKFLDEDVNIDFCFFETDKVVVLLKETGFGIIDVIERTPYPDAEYPSKRAYIWVQKNKSMIN